MNVVLYLGQVCNLIQLFIAGLRTLRVSSSDLRCVSVKMAEDEFLGLWLISFLDLQRFILNLSLAVSHVTPEHALVWLMDEI